MKQCRLEFGLGGDGDGDPEVEVGAKSAGPFVRCGIHSGKTDTYTDVHRR